MMAKKTGKSILNAAGARKYRMIAVSIALLCLLVSHTAYAQTKVPVPPGSTNLVVDTMTYNGVTVSAIYRSYDGTNGDDSTYSCAALVSRFYREVFGVTVYDLWTSSSVPKVNSGSFSLTSSPVVGDIARNNSGTHWAIVKAVDGDTVTLFEQNSWYCYQDDQYNKAWKERFISKSNGTYSFFRWSGLYIDDYPAPTIAMLSADKTSIGIGGTVNFTFSADQPCGFGFHVEANGAETDYIWTMEHSISYTFDSPGRYVVWIGAANNAGTCASGAVVVVVSPAPTNAQLTANKTNVGASGTVDFSFSANQPCGFGFHVETNGSEIDYIWTMEDSISYTFDSPGRYVVWIGAANEAGSCVSNAVVIIVSSAPTNAWLTANKTIIGVGDTLDFSFSADQPCGFGFHVETNGSEIDYIWTIEDSISYTFDTPGRYVVWIGAANEAGSCVSSAVVVMVVSEPDFILPAALTTIESQAFSGIPAKAVVIPKTVTGIASDAFSGSSITLIYGYAGSAAEAFCTNHAGFTFVEIDDAWMARH